MTSKDTNNYNNTYKNAFRKQKKETKTFKIFVGCIPGNATEESVRQIFSIFPGEKTVHLERRKNNKCSGYGYLELSSEKSYNEILKSTHTLGKRQLSVLPFLEKKELIKSQLKFNKRRIVVAQLPHGTQDKDIVKHFTKFGSLEKGFVVKNKKDPELLPYGHVIFKTEAGAIAAKNSEHYILGKKVMVKTHKIDVQKKLQEIKKNEGEDEKKEVSQRGRLRSAIKAPSKERRGREKMVQGGNFLLRKLDSSSSKSPRSLERGEDKEYRFHEICRLGQRAALYNHHLGNLRFNKGVKRRGGRRRQQRVAHHQVNLGLVDKLRLRKLAQRRKEDAGKNKGWSLF